MDRSRMAGGSFLGGPGGRLQPSPRGLSAPAVFCRRRLGVVSAGLQPALVALARDRASRLFADVSPPGGRRGSTLYPAVGSVDHDPCWSGNPGAARYGTAFAPLHTLGAAAAAHTDGRTLPGDSGCA